MILEGEIKDAKMSSFSSAFQTLIKRINEFEKSDLNPIDLFIGCTPLDEGHHFFKTNHRKKELLLKSISCFWNQAHVTKVFTGTCHCY